MKIGIVTISFNQARFLNEAIESVVTNKHGKPQYVIVDPGSTDGSIDIIKKNESRFSSIILEPDNGPSDALNKGFYEIDADILGYLNSDDRFSPGTLDFVLEFFQVNPDVDVLMGAVRIIDSKGKASIRKRVPWGFSIQNFLDETSLSLQQGTFFRRSTWLKTSGFEVRNSTSWDNELLIDLALSGASFRTIPKILGDFRIHPESITGSGQRREVLERDNDRIREKVLRAGLKPSPLYIRIVKQIIFRLHPVRRILELTVK